MENSSSLEYAQMRSELSALRADITNIDTLVSRLDLAIDKIADLSTNINKLLAVHDNKLENHTRLIDQLADAAEKRRTDADKRSQEILDKINQIREDMRTSLHSQTLEMNNRIDAKVDAVKKDIDDLKNEVSAIQRWKWIATGGAGVVGWLISTLVSFF